MQKPERNSNIYNLEKHIKYYNCVQLKVIKYLKFYFILINFFILLLKVLKVFFSAS